MTQDDIIRMAREAGFVEYLLCVYRADKGVEHLARAAYEAGAAAQREKLAHWMRSMGYATGHGDTIEDLLDHLGTQISEGLEVEALTEREACAKECDATNLFDMPITVEVAAIRKCAAAIRARSKT
jgi:hypothetical protein